VYLDVSETDTGINASYPCIRIHAYTKSQTRKHEHTHQTITSFLLIQQSTDRWTKN
jgi:hypothetical protein